MYPVDPRARIAELRKKVDGELAGLVEGFGGPPLLKKAMAHSLLSGGKRLRPLLVIAASELFTGAGPDPLPAGRDPLPAAAAVECVHTYSLIHDDLPSMDNDTLRRGVPTCHVVFGEAVAILAGDALLTEAFHVVAAAYAGRPDVAAKLVLKMASAAGSAGMVGGQVLDIVKDNPSLPRAGEGDRADLHTVHAMKTGALIRACFSMGGILGGAAQEDLAALERCGTITGLAFQVVDDCLDATGTDAELGKNAGSDAVKGKETYVQLLGLEEAAKYARELMDQALAEIAPFGAAGDLLRELIRSAVERRT
jgi:geranylgeranyl diphosphate synthase type II